MPPRTRRSAGQNRTKDTPSPPRLAQEGEVRSTERPRVLAVDDDQTTIQQEALQLRNDGFLVEVARSGEEALRMVRRIRFDAVIADLDLSSMADFHLLRQLGGIDPQLPILVCARSADLEVMLEAIRQGAYDYITKPLQDETFLIRVHKALERRRLTDLVERLDRHVKGRHRLGELIGASLPMQSLYRRVEQVAAMPGTVLIFGEPGTGKKLVARQIHQLSLFRDRPFVAVSCIEFCTTHESSRASASREGAVHRDGQDPWMRLIASHRSATLCLDGVERLPLANQADLVGALEWVERDRLPAVRAQKVRLIATTCADPDEAMEDGRLLVDLCYRLSDSVIRLPALRERVEDVQLLCNHFLDLECERIGKPVKRLSPRSLERLTAHDWPGNVAALRAMIRSAVASSRRGIIIRPQDLSFGAEIAPPPSGLSGLHTLEEAERRQIETALTKTSGNKTRAAKLLGIGRATFYRKLARMGRPTGGRGGTSGPNA